jgi:hypothetical protein
MILGDYIDSQHALWRLHFQFSQYIALIFNRFDMPKNTAFFIQESSKMKLLRLSADPGPTEIGFCLGNTHHQERQPAQQYMGANAFIL